MGKKKNYKQYIAVLNVFSCLAVVFLHANSAFWTFSYEKYWRSANVIECIFYFAVPIFFMITGVTLLDYREYYSTKEFFKKRIFKTLIPFIVWSIIGTVYYMISQNEILDFSMYYILDGIVNVKFISIYWYFIACYCVYMAIPVLALIPKNKKVKCYLYIIVLSMLFNCIVPFFANLFPERIPYNPGLRMILGE